MTVAVPEASTYSPSSDWSASSQRPLRCPVVGTIALLTTGGFSRLPKSVGIIGMGASTGWLVEAVPSSPDTLLAAHYAMVVPVPARASADLIRDLRQRSGLTWDQLGRLFGVSRRAVHLWASGGRLNAANQELLGHLLAIIDGLPGSTPEQKRTALLQPTGGEGSLFDQIRTRHASSAADINRAPFRPHELLGREDLT
jgi:DNA-binding transcriptional regulator YiaG